MEAGSGAVDGHAGEPEGAKGVGAERAGQGVIVDLGGGSSGAGGSAAAGGGKGAGALAEPGLEAGIREDALEGRGQSSGRIESNDRVIFAEIRGHFREIFHVGAGEDCCAEGGGLEQVVAAMGDERAAHEDGRGGAE